MPASAAAPLPPPERFRQTSEYGEPRHKYKSIQGAKNHTFERFALGGAADKTDGEVGQRFLAAALRLVSTIFSAFGSSSLNPHDNKAPQL
ncbi:hypothetical protein BHE74_00002072 [Ensete ventricosum]|nr:hypothetical protein BHE74_00002072 [Ensete ventricosum]